MAAIRMANYHGGLTHLSSRDDTGSNGSSPLGPVLDRKICTILFRQLSGSCTNQFRVQQGEQSDASHALPYLYHGKIQLCCLRSPY